jgi:hypothetical protein
LWWFVKATSLFYFLGKSLLKRLDERTEEVVHRVNKGILEEVHEQLSQRDRKINYVNRRLSDLTLATLNLAIIGLFPTNPPSVAEKERLQDDLRKIFGSHVDWDEFQIP